MSSRTVRLAYSPSLRAWLAWLPGGIRIVRNSRALARLERSREYRGTFREVRRVARPL